jgi:hypothetical protein
VDVQQPEVFQQKQNARQKDRRADDHAPHWRMPAVTEAVPAPPHAPVNIVGHLVAKLMRIEIAHSLSHFQVEPNRLLQAAPPKIGKSPEFTGE